MIDAWLKECPYLAPYLKEKLTADKKHTWRTAPYIHEDVREALAEDEPRPTYSIPHYSPAAIPNSSYYIPYYGAAAMMPIRASSEINMAISAQVDSLEAQIRQLERNIYINQQMLQNQTMLSMMNANRDIWGF